jgi:large subunit ribosomal protein L7e
MTMTSKINTLVSLEKKRKDIEKKSLEFISLDKKTKKRNLKMNILRKNKAQDYIKEFKKRKNDLIWDSRHCRRRWVRSYFFVPMKPRIIFAIRIKGINGIPPRARKILELLRLKRINNGIFLKPNPSSLQILKKIEPYVAYGYPTPRTIRNLITKRGHGKIGKRGKWQRVPLLDDRIIEQSLNHLGIIGLNDLINELIKGGPYFKEVNNFLWPFQLKSPKKGYSKHGKNKNISEMGAYGNWDESINHLINKMI